MWKMQFVTYLVFDAPKCTGDFEARMTFLRSVVSATLVCCLTSTFTDLPLNHALTLSNIKTQTPHARVVGHVKCKGQGHLERILAEVENVGGEGLMLRQAHSPYEYARSKKLLKVKTFFDEEAIVVGYKQGQGKNSNKMGHLVCETPDKRVFHIGSGFTDQQREHPPKLGSVVTYKYFELSAKLIPRFPIFLGVRHDLDWKDYCKNYRTPTQKKPAALSRTHTILFSDVSNVTGAGSSIAAAAAPAAPTAAAAAPAAPAAAAAPAPKTKPATSKPPCKYGSQCYRTNPEHLAKYSHPTESKPTEAKVDLAKLPKGSFIAGNGTVYIPTDDKVVPPSTSENKEIPRTASDPQLSPLAMYEEEDASILADVPPLSDSEENVSEPAAKRSRKESEETDTRPPCKYGAKCFRKNAEHLAKYSHPAAAAGSTVASVMEEKTVIMPDFVPKSEEHQTKVALLDPHDNQLYELDEGVNSIGRGFAGLLDTHISRRQLDIIVATSPYETVPPDVMVVARGVNASLVLPAGADGAETSAWHKLERDSPETVHENDTISLLNDKSATFVIKFVKAQ